MNGPPLAGREGALAMSLADQRESGAFGIKRQATSVVAPARGRARSSVGGNVAVSEGQSVDFRRFEGRRGNHDPDDQRRARLSEGGRCETGKAGQPFRQRRQQEAGPGNGQPLCLKHREDGNSVVLIREAPEDLGMADPGFAAQAGDGFGFSLVGRSRAASAGLAGIRHARGSLRSLGRQHSSNKPSTGYFTLTLVT